MAISKPLVRDHRAILAQHGGPDISKPNGTQFEHKVDVDGGEIGTIAASCPRFIAAE